MKRLAHRPFLFSLIALLLLVGLAVWPVVREIRQQAKDRALIAAVKRNDASAVVSLLNVGANANAREAPKETRPVWRRWWDMLRGRHPKQENGAPTALMVAFTELTVNDRLPSIPPGLDSHIVQALLEHGANPNVVDRDGCGPLSYALGPDNTDAALLLIQYGAQLEITRRGQPGSLLVWAIAYNAEARLLQKMLDRGVDIDALEPQDNMTALIVATDIADVSKIRFLLAHHANVAIKDRMGHTALYHAMHIARKNPSHPHAIPDIIRTLLEAGAR